MPSGSLLLRAMSRLRPWLLTGAALAQAASVAAVGGAPVRRAPASGAAASGAHVATRTVVDDLGRALRVPAPPLRIVGLAPGVTEMLFAAGAGAQVVATVEYSVEPPAARRVPRIGDGYALDMERLLALRPDVIVAWTGGGNPAQRARIASLGITVYQQELRRLNDIAPALRRLGVLAGTTATAQAGATAIERRLAQLRRGASGAAHPQSALLQIWNRPIYTVGGRQLLSDALSVCGARNVFGDLTEAAPVVDVEAVLARDPDVIIMVAPGARGAAWTADWQRFPGLAAVRHRRLLVFDDQALTRPGPSMVEATARLCERLAALNRGSY
ncbi:MAG: ABC transporter substrate-binding protein [Proteobacteria bacterium]|nr:ABC transporter substrate-binding protein [Pseudomonadota bacterium]